MVGWMLLAAMAAGGAVLAWRPGAGARLRPPGGTHRARGSPASRSRLLLSTGIGGSALVLVLGLRWWGLPVAVAIGAASFAVLGRVQSGAAQRRRTLLVAQLPQACDLLAVCLDAGLPLRRATAAVAEAVGGPLGAALGEVGATVRLGADEALAWAELGEAEPPLKALGSEVSRAVGSGVALAGTLRALGRDARREAAAAAEVAARRVGVRSVLPLMLCFLPAFLLLGVVPVIGGVAAHLLR